MAVQGDAAALTAPHCVPCSTWTDRHGPEGGLRIVGQTEVWKGEIGEQKKTDVSDIQMGKPWLHEDSSRQLFCHHNLVYHGLVAIREAAAFPLHVPPPQIFSVSFLFFTGGKNEQESGTSGSIGGYFLPLLFPKHLVFPPSRSWHQKPFWGSNLSENEVNYIQFMNLLDYKTVIFLHLSRPQYICCCR